MNDILIAQAILDFSPEKMKMFYARLVREVKVNRHANCELQFQQIIAAIIDPDGPIDLEKIVSSLLPPPTPEEESWNDRKEIDGIWH